MISRWVHRLIGGDQGLRPRGLFTYAALVGVAAGLLEAVYLTARQHATGLLASGYHLDLLWMTPLMGAVTFLAIAALLFGVAVLAGTSVGLTQSTGVFAFVAIHGVMQSPGIPIHPWAELVWSLGAASVAAKIASDRAEGLTSYLRRAPLHLAVASAVLVTLAIARHPSIAERRALRDLPDSAGGLPNVLLIILDTVRAANLGLYGYGRPTTPELERWAESGVVYERAYSTAPWTLPSHASIFTGRYPFQTRTGISRPLDPETPTLAEVLSHRGYATAGFVANLLYTSPTSGLDRGFARYQAHRRSMSNVARSYWLPRVLEGWTRRRRGLSTRLVKDGRHVTAEFLGWLDRRDDRRPFFAFLNYFDAHDPYEPPEPYSTMFGPGPSEPWGQHLIGLGRRRDSASRSELSAWVRRYDGGIAYVDTQLGAIRRRLEAQGLLEETIVVITSDHGEAWGEHGLIGHLNALYVPLLHVPLVLSYAERIPPRSRVDGPVTLRDLPATILDLAGLSHGSPIPGASLLDAAAPAVSPVLAELHAYQRLPKASLFVNELHYLYDPERAEELYDLGQDPDESNDLSSDAGYAFALDELRAELRRLGLLVDGAPASGG